MDIDPDIANWVLEYLLKKPIEGRTINSLLHVLPLPNNNPNLIKLLLLKKIESEISRSSITESMLEFLELLEEIEFHQGNESVSDAMKHAYCMVAVECTVMPLVVGDDGDNSSKYMYFDVVKRLWRGRIGKMMKVVENGGLGSEELSVWKEEIEDALWDDNVCESVVRKCKELRAVDAVRAYLIEERERMGPSFLELVAAKVKDDEVVKEILGVGTTDVVVGVEEAPSNCVDRSKGKDDAIVNEILGAGTTDVVMDVEEEAPSHVEEESSHGEEAPSQSVDRVADVGNVGNETPTKGRIQLRPKLLGLRRSTRHKSRNSRKANRMAKIVDSDEIAVEPSHGNHNSQSSEEVNRVREALESSVVDLQAVVQDPLPDALQVAETISGTVKENNVSNVRKPGLMERNKSAHTYEWSESIDEAEENEASGSKPLNRYEMKNVQKRRKRKFWSVAEEDTLRAGVKKFGKGNWKAILMAYRDMFDDRTDGDLKDKWRNLTRCGAT